MSIAKGNRAEGLVKATKYLYRGPCGICLLGLHMAGPLKPKHHGCK